MIIDEIVAALFASHSSDLKEIGAYVRWVAFRRYSHDRFYPSAHWVKSTQSYHWL